MGRRQLATCFSWWLKGQCSARTTTFTFFFHLTSIQSMSKKRMRNLVAYASILLAFWNKVYFGFFFSAFILLVRFPRFSDNTRMIKTFHWRVIWAPSIFSSHNEHREEWRYVPFSCFTREAKTFIMLGKQQQKRKPWIPTFLSSKKGNMSTWSFLDYFQL